MLFYGMVNERRRQVLQNLESRCRLAVLTGVFGAERDALIARAKIVLNLHYYETCILEQTRVSYLLNNGACVVSEDSPSNPYEGMIATAPREKLADLCLEWLGAGPAGRVPTRGLRGVPPPPHDRPSPRCCRKTPPRPPPRPAPPPAPANMRPIRSTFPRTTPTTTMSGRRS